MQDFNCSNWPFFRSHCAAYTMPAHVPYSLQRITEKSCALYAMCTQIIVLWILHPMCLKYEYGTLCASNIFNIQVANENLFRSFVQHQQCLHSIFTATHYREFYVHFMQCAPNFRSYLCLNIKIKSIALLNFDFFFRSSKRRVGKSDRIKRNNASIINITSINTKMHQ